jgi:hypothetical protein
LLKSRSIQTAPAEPAVIVVVWKQGPTCMLLAFDEGLGRLALRVERVELLLETLTEMLPAVAGGTIFSISPGRKGAGSRPVRRASLRAPRSAAERARRPFITTPRR